MGKAGFTTEEGSYFGGIKKLVAHVSRTCVVRRMRDGSETVTLCIMPWKEGKRNSSKNLWVSAVAFSN